MEKELKIAELAALWCVSVPTCWNRIKKEMLTTFKKKDETNKDISYVSISDEVINKYVINDVNNVNNNINNGYYEELLTDNKVKNNESSINTSNIIQELINYNKANNEELKTVYNDYNNRIERLQDELITYKSRVPLLEDKASREGLYLKEIEDLKKEKKTDKILIKVLITFIILFIMIFITFITYFITVNNLTNTENEKLSIEQVSTVEM